MLPVTLEFLTDQLELGEQLRIGRKTMLEPQDLPGRFGRVVKAIDHVLRAIGCESVVAGGWAVWRHGYVARLTQDVDIVLPKSDVEEFLRVASLSGFEILQQPEGRWPKLQHKETGIEVDILPEGGRPGTASHPAPTTIPHPKELGASGSSLRYITLPSLMELKLAAGRARDESDVAELLRADPRRAQKIRSHLVKVHADYVRDFDRLVQRAREQEDQ
jgi:hypothetical protein